jgi:hypothetical protein
MVKHIVHLFVLSLRALIMVVASFPTPHACGGPVTGKVCPVAPSAHHRVLHISRARLSAVSPSGLVSWRIAPAGTYYHQP